MKRKPDDTIGPSPTLLYFVSRGLRGDLRQTNKFELLDQYLHPDAETKAMMDRLRADLYKTFTLAERKRFDRQSDKGVEQLIMHKFPQHRSANNFNEDDEDDD